MRRECNGWGFCATATGSTYVERKGQQMHVISAPIVYKAAIKRAVMLFKRREPMAALTTHVLNTAIGMPAAGMRIELKGLGPVPISPSVFVTNADGRCAAPLLQAEQLRVGRYTLTFDVAAYFRSINVSLADPPFLDQVVIAFGIADAGQNYHVPLLISPWSYSTYRGS